MIIARNTFDVGFFLADIFIATHELDNNKNRLFEAIMRSFRPGNSFSFKYARPRDRLDVNSARVVPARGVSR